MSLLKVFDQNKPTNDIESVAKLSIESVPLINTKPQKTPEHIKSFMLIDQEADVHGRINTAGDVVIEGRFDGEINARHLTVREGGEVNGIVKVKAAWIDGKLAPEIECDGLLTIHAKGLVSGNIRYGDLIVEKGGKCRGQMDFDDKEES